MQFALSQIAILESAGASNKNININPHIVWHEVYLILYSRICNFTTIIIYFFINFVSINSDSSFGTSKQKHINNIIALKMSIWLFHNEPLWHKRNIVNTNERNLK